jgi:DNA polymerase-4
MERAVIHLNIADFAVAVETNRSPALRGRPLIIAPEGAPRAVVYDMSDKAYQEGIRKGMPLARARRLDRNIPVLAPGFNRYEAAMKDLLKETFAFTPLVEYGQADGHIFMDVTASGRLFGPSADMAFRLKKTFKSTFNLDPIWSVATSKLVAKVATRLVKPLGEYIVAPGDEEAFLAPLPLHLIPGLTTADLNRLGEFNLFSVSEARRLTLEQLKIPFLQKAPLIYDWIRGMDPAPVRAFSETASTLSADHEFSDDTNHAGSLRSALYLMIEQICKALRDKNLHGGGTKLILSYSDGVQSASTSKLSPSTSNDTVLFKKCALLLDKAWTRRVRIRHMRLICKTLCPPMVQAELFAPETRETKQAALIRAMDKIRNRFGHAAIQAGLTLTSDTTPP